MTEASLTVDTSDGQANVDQPVLVDQYGNLVDDLSARGLMPSAVLKLLGSISSDRLDKIPDYL